MTDPFITEAFKAAANTVLRDLARKWEREGIRCGEEAQRCDDEWEPGTAAEFRERRTIYLECAADLEAAWKRLFHSPTHRPTDP